MPKKATTIKLPAIQKTKTGKKFIKIKGKKVFIATLLKRINKVRSTQKKKPLKSITKKNLKSILTELLFPKKEKPTDTTKTAVAKAQKRKKKLPRRRGPAPPKVKKDKTTAKQDANIKAEKYIIGQLLEKFSFNDLINITKASEHIDLDEKEVGKLGHKRLLDVLLDAGETKLVSAYNRFIISSQSIPNLTDVERKALVKKPIVNISETEKKFGLIIDKADTLLDNLIDDPDDDLGDDPDQTFRNGAEYNKWIELKPQLQTVINKSDTGGRKHGASRRMNILNAAQTFYEQAQAQAPAPAPAPASAPAPAPDPEDDEDEDDEDEPEPGPERRRMHVPLGPAATRKGQGGGLMTNPDDALDNTQIDKIMNKYRGFKGTFPKDHFYKAIREITPKSRGGAVLNLDPSDEPGSHWIAAFWDGRPNGSHTVEYVDSFGRDPPKEIKDDLLRIPKKLEADEHLKLKVNGVKKQDPKSVSCGFHAVNFLMNRFRGHPFSKATGFKSIDKNEKHMDDLKRKFDFML